MPGFSNYEISSGEESIEPITRRYYIEQMKDEDISKVKVTALEMPEEVKVAIQEKMKKNKEESENN